MKLKPEQEAQAKTILSILPLFEGCTEEQLNAIVPLLDQRDVTAGKIVLMDQEIGKTLFIIAKGKVGVYKRVAGERKQLATLSAPNFVGERTMFEESPASALVKAEDMCQLYALDKPSFDQVAARFPAIADTIRKNMDALRSKRLSPVQPKRDSDA